jgi:hypothetical protein
MIYAQAKRTSARLLAIVFKSRLKSPKFNAIKRTSRTSDAENGVCFVARIASEP